MRILTNKQYDAICEIVMDQKKEIEQLRKEKARAERDLKDLQRFCMNFASDQSKRSLDFPNSYKSYEDKIY